jgi:hypothetical protein
LLAIEESLLVYTEPTLKEQALPETNPVRFTDTLKPASSYPEV